MKLAFMELSQNLLSAQQKGREIDLAMPILTLTSAGMIIVF
jgi:hypothetical protein